MWWGKTAHRAIARLRFYGTRAAEGGEAHTILLGEVPLAINQIISYIFPFEINKI
jgi:hypothetical protein